MIWDMGNRIILQLTSLSVVVDFNRSTIFPDDVLPEDPGAIIQVFVVDNLHSSLQDLCGVIAHAKGN